MFARLIHDHSPQKRGPFVPFNCSAVARELVESQLFGHRRGAFTGAVDAFPGVIRAAERGTLFLDEIGDLEPRIQPKLLRFLESGEIQPVGDARPQHVAVRIVAATNADLEALAEEGGSAATSSIASARRGSNCRRSASARTRFRRSRRCSSHGPPQECGRKGLRLGDDLIAALLLYDWPGNIRQLANEIRRVAAMATDGQTLVAADLTPEVTANWNARPPYRRVQRRRPWKCVWINRLRRPWPSSSGSSSSTRCPHPAGESPMRHICSACRAKACS